MPTIHAPVRLTNGKWAAVRFTPATGQTECYTCPDSSVSFQDTTGSNVLSPESHLERLKSKAIAVLPGARDAIRAACPAVSLVSGQELGSGPIVLSLSEDRSWELAYVLSCFATAGKWDDAWMYWATGEIGDDGKLAARDVSEKLTFVLDQPGRLNFLLPDDARNVVEQSAVPDRLFTFLKDVGSLLLEATSPLSKPLVDFTRFSSVGSPPVLAEFLNPTTFVTRRPFEQTLASLLRDNQKRLILLTSPFGWGKTTVLARALRSAGNPVLVVDLAGAKTRREGIDATLQKMRGQLERDFEEVDQNQWRVASLLRQIVPSAVLVFINGNVNALEKFPSEIQQFIVSLVHEHFRCVVECWSPADWSSIRINSSNIEVVQWNSIPRLTEAEVSLWLSTRGIDDPDVAEEFEWLGGHPRGISATITKLLDDEPLNLPVSAEAVLDQARMWVEEEPTRSYIQRVEVLLNCDLTERVMEWFTIFWPHDLPRKNLTSSEVRQLNLGVRLGLLSSTAEGYRPHGWFHLFCRLRLQRVSDGDRDLTVDVADLTLSDATAIARLLHHVTELAAELSAYRLALKRLASELHNRLAATPEEVVEYVAPISPQVLETIPPGEGSIAEQIWLIEQACRNLLRDEAGHRWDDVVADEKAVRQTLQNNWASLRLLSRAYHLSSVLMTHPASRASALLRVLESLDITNHSGHKSYAATLALQLVRDLSRAGHGEEAARALALARQAVGELPKPSASDFRYLPWVQLAFRLRRQEYLVAPTHDEALALLTQLTELTNRGMEADTSSLAWQRRYLAVLAETIELTRGEVEDQRLWDHFIHCEPALLTTFLIDRLFMFSDYESDTQTAAQQMLTRLMGNIWKHRSGLEEIASQRDFLVLFGGLALGASRAHALAQTTIEKLATGEGEGAQLNAGEYLKLLTACLRIANATKETARKIRIPTLERRVIDGLCAAANPRDVARFSAVYVKFAGYRIVERATYRQGAFADLDDLVQWAIEKCPTAAAEMLAQQYDVASVLWQQLRRSSSERTGTGPVELKRISDQMMAIAPGHPLALRYRAKYLRYVWQYDEAYAVLESALPLAGGARRRRQLLVELAEMLTVSVLTPPVLRTEYTPEPIPARVTRLQQIARELASIYREHNELWIIAGGVQSDELFWEEAARTIEARLGTPEQFWQRASTQAWIETDEEGTVESSVADLTDSVSMRIASVALTWASEQQYLSARLRLRLVNAALSCVWAAWEWERGSTGSHRLSTDFRLACVIALALRHTSDGKLFGQVNSPFRSKKRGRTLLWRDAARTRFESVASRSVGAFAKHVRTIAQRLI